MRKSISFFDLDKTLLNTNVSKQFGEYLFQKSYFSLYRYLQLMILYIRHRFFGLTYTRLHQKTFDTVFQSRLLTTLEAHCAAFLQKYFDTLINPVVYERFRLAKAAGHYTVILSCSPTFIVGPIAQRFGVDEWHATRYDADKNGRLEVVSQVMGGKNKAHLVSLIASHQNIAKKYTHGYTDSCHDLPFLEAVGHPVGVMTYGDSRLRRICERRNWEILE